MDDNRRETDLLASRLSGLGPCLSDVVSRLDGIALKRAQSAQSFELTIDANWIAELFDVDDEAACSRASLGGVLLYAHTTLQDHRIDDEITDPALTPGVDLLCNVLLVESLRQLSVLARGDNRFWEATRAAFDQLASACADEPTLGLILGADRTHSRVLSLLADRVASVRIVVAALACYSNLHDRIEPVNRGLDRLLVAIQIRDGITDWREDHARARPTLVLLRMADRIGKDLSDCTSDELADALYLFGGIEALVSEIHEHLHDAVAQVSAYRHEQLANYIATFGAECHALAECVRAHKEAAIDGTR